MPKKETEKELQARIAENFKNIGCKVQEYVKTPVGILDLLITELDGKEHLIEVKRESNGHSILQALGQIRGYALYYPNAKLSIYTSIPRHRPTARRTVSVWTLQRNNPDIAFVEF